MKFITDVESFDFFRRLEKMIKSEVTLLDKHLIRDYLVKCIDKIFVGVEIYTELVQDNEFLIISPTLEIKNKIFSTNKKIIQVGNIDSDNDINKYSLRKIDDLGINEVMDIVMERVREMEKPTIIIDLNILEGSYDIDFLNPNMGGLSFRELKEVVRRVSFLKNINKIVIGGVKPNPKEKNFLVYKTVIDSLSY